MPPVVLRGCAPDVAIKYLKGLGIFRAVSRQENGDPGATARWADEGLVLDTALGADGLASFFLDRYEPPPLMSPWNVSSGFYTDKGMAHKMLRSKAARLEGYRKAVDEALCMLRGIFGPDSFLQVDKREGGSGADALVRNIPDKTAIRDKKNDIRSEARNRLPDDVVEWIDAVTVMAATEKWTPGPILGSSGTDGKIELSNTYMKYVLEYVRDDRGEDDEALVRNALFGEAARLPLKVKGAEVVAGHLHPGAFTPPATGLSPSPGLLHYTMLNPWDYMLAMEGALFFGGGVSRRGERGYPAFPFSVNTSWAGHDTACYKENPKGKDSGEIWMPLWDRPATYGEIRHVFYEGLVQSSKRPTTGAAMAVALANHGAMRGLYAFERYAMLVRKGQAHHLVNVGRVWTGDPHDGGRLLQEIEPWLDSVRSKGDKLPALIRSHLRSADDMIIRYCRDKSPERLQGVLVALGRLEKRLALSPRLNVGPLGSLSPEWLPACNTETAEYRLAAALSSIGTQGGAYPVRFNLERVRYRDQKRQGAGRPRGVEWAASSPAAVAGGNDLVRNMIAVLGRRCVDGQGSHSREQAGSNEDNSKKEHSEGEPDTIPPLVPLTSSVPAPVGDVVEFIEGRVNDDLIGDLALPMSAIAYGPHSRRALYGGEGAEYRLRIPPHVPASYACLKANFPPVPPQADGAAPVFENTIVGLLRAGKAERATRIAMRRLKISGYCMPVQPHAGAEQEPDASSASRLCASLLFPLREDDMLRLIRTAEVDAPSNAKRKKWKWGVSIAKPNTVHA